MDIKDRVREKTAKLDFRGALADIASLRNPVDAFFDKVMVMAEDEQVRQNRLALLTAISRLFSGIADFVKKVAPLQNKEVSPLLSDGKGYYLCEVAARKPSFVPALKDIRGKQPAF